MSESQSSPPTAPATPGNGAKSRVLLVDDHPGVHRGLALMIDAEPDLMICGEAENYEQAIEAVDKLAPDVAVVGVSLSGRSGIDLIKELRTKSPSLPVLVLSMHDESLQAERALRAGAK